MTLVTVKLDLWNEIKSVLEARQFISDGEDEDNDYEVQAVLRRMESEEVTIL